MPALSLSSNLKQFLTSSLFLLALLLSLSLKGCFVAQNNQVATLKVGMNNWPGYALALYAREKGLFEQRGLKVKLTRFNNQQDNIRATLRGTLDASFVPLWEVMQVDPANDRPAFVLVADVSFGSDGIVSQPGIKSIKELKGKRIGAKLGTVSHLILLEALNAHNLEPSQVTIQDYLNETSLHKLKEKELDAAVLWEPSLSTLAQEINGNIIFTTKDVDSLVIDGLASRQSFVDSHQEELSKFILAWFDAIQAWQSNPNEVFSIIAEQLGQSSKSFAQDYAGLKQGDIAMNQKMFAGHLNKAKEQIIRLLEEDPRHSRVIREDVVFDARPLNTAIETWKS